MEKTGVLIIGSGFGGMAAAIGLLERDRKDFVILERDEEPGGTWWRNSYPGAAVDVESHLYQLSFAPYDWTRRFAQRDELLAYTRHVYDTWKLDRFVHCGARVTSLTWDEHASGWVASLADGRQFQAQDVINATGGLSQPCIPDFPGLFDFQGRAFHTSHWPDDWSSSSGNLTGKRIAVIGSGASAIQVVPAIAEAGADVHVFQRTPHWVLPKPDGTFKAWQRRLLRVPALRRFYRAWLYAKLEYRQIAFAYWPPLIRLLGETEARWFLRRQVKDPALRAKLTPNYTIGCKRILLSNAYYQTLQRENVTLHDKEDGIRRFRPEGLETALGNKLGLDAVVFATGFEAASGAFSFPVIGPGGHTLQEAWKDAPHAYLGTSVPNFPNLYFLLGPNTGTGHTSAIYMIESQLGYVFGLLAEKQSQGAKAVTVSEKTESAHNDWLQARMKKTVWVKGGCQSWYQTENGVNSVIYPAFTFGFRKKCRIGVRKRHVYK